MVFYNCGSAFLEDVSSRNEGTFLLEIMEGGLSCEIRVVPRTRIRSIRMYRSLRWIALRWRVDCLMMGQEQTKEMKNSQE